MMEPRVKKIATIIVGGGGGPKPMGGEEESYGEEVGGDEALIMASKGVLKAIKSGDARMLAESMKAAFSCMGGERDD